MKLEIKTTSLQPIRNTFANIERRFGDKPASRYQEATYDLQAETNFHYRPLWQPQHELNDKSRTQIVMADWYDLKDPASFTMALMYSSAPAIKKPLKSTIVFLKNVVWLSICLKLSERM